MAELDAYAKARNAFVASPEVVAICCDAADTAPAEEETSPIVTPSFVRIAL